MPHSIHSVSNILWEAVISNIKTHMRIGIHEHETKPQNILVSATIRGHYSAYPKHISECINYEVLQDLILNRWSNYPQVMLIETLVMECFEEIFTCCSHASEATVCITKPDIFANTESVGMKLTLQRSEYLKLKT